MLKKLMILVFLLSCGFLFSADGEEERKWTNNMDLSAIWTDGNSESASFGFDNKYTYTDDKFKFTWNVDVDRVETTSLSLQATSTDSGPIVEEIRTTETTTESYDTDLEYSREMSERTSWYIALGLSRNVPSGYNSRLTPELGLTTNWIKEDSKTFSTSYGFSQTLEDPVSEGDDDSYTSGVLSYDFMYKFGNAQFDQDFKTSIQISGSSGWVTELKNSLSVAMTNRLALKISLDLNYDDNPNSVDVTIVGGPFDGSEVAYPKEELDTTFNASLSINF